ncbi:hypothetical protein [Streptomyces sp. NPDC004286]|uniref:hypothetical protein n=1 Tax=Streptomyces sp. NPDC004286 TaxID=3364696 RepID=UPI0036BE7E43
MTQLFKGHFSSQEKSSFTAAPKVSANAGFADRGMTWVADRQSEMLFFLLIDLI